MKERAKELKAASKKADLENDLLAHPRPRQDPLAQTVDLGGVEGRICAGLLPIPSADCRDFLSRLAEGEKNPGHECDKTLRNASSGLPGGEPASLNPPS